MIDKLIAVIKAVDGCEGWSIPYPIAKKMVLIRCALQAVVDEATAQQPIERGQADEELICALCGKLGSFVCAECAAKSPAG